VSKPPHNQRRTKEKKRQADEDILPIIGPKPTAIPEPPPTPPQDCCAREKSRWTKDPPMFWVTLAGVIVVVAYTSVAAWQAYLTRSQLDVMQRVMERDQRARLTVHQIYLPIKADIPLVGKMIVLNGGVTNAHINRGTAQIYWANNLHQLFPPDQAPIRPNPIPPKDLIIEGGGKYWWNIDQKAPLPVLTEAELKKITANNGELNLWVIGLLDYIDNIGIDHVTLFCRRYNPATDRFEATNDPDYEYAN
jgi:hypothetical protein